MPNYCFANGKITELSKVSINPYDLGFLRSYGVFDVMCTQNGKPFLLDEHWRRLKKSAEEIGLPVPISKKDYQANILKLLKANNFEKANIRTVLTGGVSENGFNYQKGNETFCIFIEKFHALPETVFQRGVKVITLPYQRQFHIAKTINYIAAIKNQKNKIKNQATEILYIDKEMVYEASTSNIFMVKNNKLFTTKDGILLGITRNLTLRLARQVGLEVTEKAISLKELLNADEVFLTATNKDIVPIIQIDKQKIGNGKIGPVTKKIMAAFDDFTKKY